ncbi:MAG: NUDIX hydrolase [Clostridiales bacterium]|nr:NUDIX hydrolase [Clostridiales bacterium]
MELCEKTIERDYVFKGKVINVRRDTAQLPNGKLANREVVEHTGGVTIAALTDDDELLFVRQFRYPIGEVLMELPAGKLNVGEDPLAAAARELLEETGAVARNFYDLGWIYTSPGYTTERLYLYAADGLTFKGQHLDEDEFLDVLRVPLTEAVRHSATGGYGDAKTDIAILRLDALRRIGMPEPIHP